MRMLLPSAVSTPSAPMSRWAPMIVAVLGLLLLAAPGAYATACSSNATGNWSAPATWTTCNGVVPTSADTVEILGGFTVTVDVSNAVAASIQIGASSGVGSGTLVFNSGSHLTVTGAVTVGGITSGRTGTLTMTNGGTVTAGSLALSQGTPTWTPGTGTVELTAANTLPATTFTTFNNLTITTGTTTLGGNIAVNGTLTQTAGIAVGTFTLTVTGTHKAGTSTVSGAGAYVLGPGPATLQSGSPTGVNGNITTTSRTLPTSANYTFNGASPQVTGTLMPATVNDLTISNAAGVTLSQDTTTNGNLAVTSGTFAVGAFGYSVAGTSTVSGTLSITSATGAKTFTGNVTINNTGTWNESANAAISFGGSLQNDGTFTANTGVHTFTGTTQTISGANAIAIPSLSISVTTTNNGTLTVSTTLAGAGTFTNGANATLSFGGSSITPTLTATALNNSVNYTLAGAQTVRGTTYYNLTLLGSGSKTTGGITVNGTLSMQGTATASAAPTYGATATLEYKGSAAQVSGPELLTTMAAGRTVIINNAAGVTLGVNTTVNGTLTFTIGNVTTGATTLYIGSGGTVSRTSGHVAGNFKKFIATGATNMTFEVGGPSNYTPVIVSFASVTTAGDLTASVVSGDHPNIGTSTINAALSVNRNWTLTNSGIVFTNYSATFTFVAGDVDAGASTSAFSVGRYSSGSWTYPAVGTKTATSTQATGLAAFGEFQVGTITYAISGHIMNASSIAISGVTITLSGGQAGSTSTDVNGAYSFASLPSGNNYTVTPTRTNYTFSATSLTYNNLSANQTTADSTGSSTITYTISGHVQNSSSTAISGVTVTLSGGQSGSTATDASGNYSFAGLPSTNNYTVTPAKTNYTFSTATLTYNALAANQPSADFTGTSTITYTISGHIQNGSAAAISGVTLNLSGGQAGTTTTDASGNYSFASLPSTNNYTVTASLTGYSFSPTSLTYNALAAAQPTADFTGTVAASNISGHIADGSSTAISGVTVTLSGGQSGTTTTDGSGNYSFAGVTLSLNYTVTPAKTNYAFSPASWTFNNLSAPQVADFTAALIPNITLTASVSPAGTVQPRTDLVYTISFSNGGAGSASTFVITDPIPTNTDFKLGSVTTSLGTTGLTPTLAYSNDGGATWIYTPASAAGGAPAGYDRNVTAVRWSFAASLSQASPNNAGSVTLTVRIR